MKKIMFICFGILSTLTAKGQQNLSYSYDAAGNRTNRTIIVGTQNSSQDTQQKVSRVYVDSLAGKELSVHVDNQDTLLNLSIKGHDPSSGEEYSLLDREGKTLIMGQLSNQATPIKLKELASGTYTLHIFVNRQSSTWKLVKL
ncbi:T9SS type A sorting domain-containing protein [Sphingobacterium phlebotomi]|uniref:T9SS type A sorting domain-containing protein n=1 Tax=Sphingobacterium phlebotomi TaxID=2605433 RepID=A0A5D4HF16_9SPHI|nr:T9SS type A sorting domain-containing protein [Sphingobacterium phlebotomi]TYR37430.1 T9SS type A sorting domain-containing protein [Sphingobacterium phlebotomi]